MLTYNQERYIGEAIRSVMLQKTDFPFELIIGNDASTDQTGKICGEWQKQYPEKIVLLNRKENIGLQRNFLQTYAACQGKYIAICEGDDFWVDKHKLQRQVDFLENNSDFSMCFHRVINYFEGKGTKSLSNGKQKIDTDILDLAQSNYISNVSVVFRRVLGIELPDWFDQVTTYDYPLHLLNAQYGKIHYMAKPMAVYRQRSLAIWSTAGTEKRLMIALQVRELLMDYFKDKRTDVYDCLRTASTRICIALLDFYQKNGGKEQVENMERKILYFHPDWTSRNIKELLARWDNESRHTLQKHLARLLKLGRASVSYFIPIPRI